MGRPFNTPIKIPQWLRALPADSLLCARDIVPLFGFASSAVLRTEVCDGHFPKPEYKMGRCRQSEWKAITIRNEIRRRAKLNAERAKP